MPATPASEPASADSSDEREPMPAPAPETQEQRAMRALQAIFSGADLTEEATKLSNEFTDRHTARFSAWFRRVVLRRE